MAVTSGFYNSLNNDRKYNAMQIANLLDGVINDGIFMTVGDHFAVTENTGMTIKVGKGRAWFNKTWLDNDAQYILSVDPSDLILPRIDAVVIEVNTTQDVRAGTIKMVRGTANASPVAPTMTSTATVHQYPLAHIAIAASSASIVQANVTNKVGTVDCPYVTGILETSTVEAQTAIWEAKFLEWFHNLEYVLDGDVAGHLQNQINTVPDIIQSAIDTSVDVGVFLDSFNPEISDKWLYCNGGFYKKSEYPELYAMIKTQSNMSTYQTIGSYFYADGLHFLPIINGNYIRLSASLIEADFVYMFLLSTFKIAKVYKVDEYWVITGHDSATNAAGFYYTKTPLNTASWAYYTCPNRTPGNIPYLFVTKAFGEYVVVEHYRSSSSVRYRFFYSGSDMSNISLSSVGNYNPSADVTLENVIGFDNVLYFFDRTGSGSSNTTNAYYLTGITGTLVPTLFTVSGPTGVSFRWNNTLILSEYSPNNSAKTSPSYIDPAGSLTAITRPASGISKNCVGYMISDDKAYLAYDNGIIYELLAPNMELSPLRPTSQTATVTYVTYGYNQLYYESIDHVTVINALTNTPSKLPTIADETYSKRYIRGKR